ncbi:hypothetical protein FA95DRAFT_1568814 [Auriscalpium vulgare]|uniref:Uncharacterized protein n=1 Tax=Auriscalpium vulgare TaxID=40419 RepID=A0ACB8SB83_9AGAM|nr:hypothetical protein FA95DRAFT_1568814 [Auriscalpium vulgare]
MRTTVLASTSLFITTHSSTLALNAIPSFPRVHKKITLPRPSVLFSSPPPSRLPCIDPRSITLPPTFDHGPATILLDLSFFKGLVHRELDKLKTREPGLIDVLKPLGTGTLGGGAVQFDHFFGGGDSSSAFSRSVLPAFDSPSFDNADLSSLPIGLKNLEGRSIVGSLLGATENSLGTVLKTSAAGGLASGAVAAAGGALEHLFGDKQASSNAASDLLGKVFGNSDSSSRRDVTIFSTGCRLWDFMLFSRRYYHVHVLKLTGPTRRTMSNKGSVQ